MFKPTFTSQPATNATFGFGQTSTASPFGQSTFGKVNTPGTFGATSSFGAPAATPLFGAQTQPSTGLFGQTNTVTPGFGQQAPQQSGFGFGQTSSATQLFGQPTQSSTGLFGSASTSNTFGQKPNTFSTFGQPAATGSLFGQGQTQTQNTATPLFGQTTTTNNGLFGSTTAFGTQNQSGTVIKFTPVTGTDTMIKNRITHSISTRHHCITFMKEYENKSLEELRYEDYLAGRKGPGAQGQPQTTTQPTNNLFGQIGTTQQPTNNLFGASTATPQNTAFGQTSSVFGQPAQNTLFQQKSTFGTNTAASSPFSFNQTPNQTPFGSTAPKPFGTAQPLFSTTATSGTNTFGQQNTTFGTGFPTSSTSGFLTQSKPATNTFGGLQPTATSTGFGGFGTQPQTNLFGGAKPATNVFQTSSATNLTTFGQPQTQQPSLFMNNQTFNKPATGFGVATQSQPLMGTGTGLFNMTPSSSNTSLFADRSGSTTSLFGVNSTQNLAQPFGLNLMNQNQTQSFPMSGQQNQPYPVRKIVLFDQLSNSSGSSTDIACLAHLPPDSDTNKQRTTNPAAINMYFDAKFKTAKPESLTSDTNNLSSGSSTSLINSLFDGLEFSETKLSPNGFRKSSRNPRRLYIPKASTEKMPIPTDETITSNEKTISDFIAETSQVSETAKSKEWSSADTLKSPESQMKGNLSDLSNPETKQTRVTNLKKNIDNAIDVLVTNSTPVSGNPSKIICTRPQYYTIPSLDELNRKVTFSDGRERLIVQGFTIGRQGYGNVFFPDTFDIFGINIDQDVHFESKELTIYLDDENKPPVGEELNRPAQITLDQVYPRDKDTHQLITDPNRLNEMGWEETLRSNCEKYGTKFIEYRYETGSWVFAVEHFTRYGVVEMMETDQESIHSEPVEANDGIEVLYLNPNIKYAESQTRLFQGFDDERQPNDKAPVLLSSLNSEDDSASVSGSSASGIIAASNYVERIGLTEEQCYMNLVARQNLLLFQDPDHQLDSAEQLEGANQDFIVEKDLCEVPLPLEIYEEVEECDDIEEIELNEIYKTLSIDLNNIARNIYDMALFKGNGFRSQFVTSKNELLVSGKKSMFNGEYLFDSLKPLTSDNEIPMMATKSELKKINQEKSPVVLTLKVGSQDLNDDLFKTVIQEHLLVQLTHDDIYLEEHGFPKATTLQGPKALHQHAEVAQSHINKYRSEPYLHYMNYLWKLFEALWGEVLELESEPISSHFTTTVRRELLSNWMESYMNDSQKQRTMWEYILAHKLSEASDYAFNANNIHLSSLILQLGSNVLFRNYIENQLEAWKIPEIDAVVENELKKVYLLLSGTINKFPNINVYDECDWLQAFAIHLWYLTPLEYSITDVTLSYTEAFSEGHMEVPPPKPKYSDAKSFDLMYHLLCLYSDSMHSMERLLDPATYTEHLNDYSLSWLVLENLFALNYVHIQDKAQEKIHQRFALQLESLGLWEWALYVILHMKNLTQRKFLVTEIINRHVQLPDKHGGYQDYLRKENFAVQELLIPPEYFSRAKGHLAVTKYNCNAALCHYIAGKDKEMATKLFWDSVAPNEIVNKNYNYVKKICEYLISENAVPDFYVVVYQFIVTVDEKLQQLKSQANATSSNLPSINITPGLQKLLTHLCNKIICINMSVQTPHQCLMLSELSKDIVNFLRAVATLVDAKDFYIISTIATLAAKLPIQSDYVLEEAKNLISLYIRSYARVEQSNS